jgi:hypothetical protein
MLPFNCVKVLLIGLNGLDFTFGGSGHGVQFPHGTTAAGGGGRYSLHQANQNIDHYRDQTVKRKSARA